MALTRKSALTAGLTVTLSGVADSSGGDTVFSNQAKYSSRKNITAQRIWADVRTLPSGGTETLDLSSLTGSDEMPDTDFTGFKLAHLGVDCPTGNSALINFDVGSSNGYNFLGSATSEIDVQPDGSALFDMPTGTPVVSSTAKNIDVSGTAGDVYDIVMAAI